MKAAIDIIYNMTLICPHDCVGCCVDAMHVTRRGDEIIIRTSGLREEERIPRGDRKTSIYDAAALTMQKQGLELTLEQKLRIISHIDLDNVKLDISGGDPLAVTENLAVLRAASAKFGRERITLTSTGSGVARIDLKELTTLAGEFNFTYDSASPDDVEDRPATYASSNLKLGRKLAALGAATRAEFPITRATSDPDHVERLYMQLHHAGISKLLLMRLFPVGRGAAIEDKTLKTAEYLTAIAQLRALEKQFGSPKVKLQCALRHIESHVASNAIAGSNPCDFVRESFGLTSRGLLLASPWAINDRGGPMHPDFVIGSLLQTPLSLLLASEKVARIRERADENFGHCKIFSWMFSTQQGIGRLFDKADPLFE
ncbi:radical SAM protein [Rhizobium leguminosarum]